MSNQYFFTLNHSPSSDKMCSRVTLLPLFDRLGLIPTACEVIYTLQWIDNLDEITLLTYTECESLCKIIRHPGEYISNPNAAVPG